ncbi:MAG: hypothetical protein M1828_006285 [Chrysothrix sp. TS-e1954]|nr:MAG: hypothetical protein M1828_006285 [Chrysothrix sp. TS-e1954]
MSDDASSGLSEPADVLEDQSSGAGADPEVRDDLVKDNDTEAETERLEETPQKPHPSTTMNAYVLGEVNEHGRERSDDEDSHESQSPNLDSSDQHHPSKHSEPRNQSPKPVTDVASLATWPTDEAQLAPGKPKRKRSSSLTSQSEDYAYDVQHRRKRSASSQLAQDIRHSPEIRNRPEMNHERDISEHGIVDNDMREAESHSERKGSGTNVAVDMNTTGITFQRRRESDEGSDLTGKGSAAKSEGPEPIEGDFEGEEDDDSPQLDPEGEPIEDVGVEREVEIFAKSEDELAKKKAALEKLTPIENHFAIFRDKLFDEKLTDIAAELEILNSPLPTHPLLLAQIRCVDARRDEKIRLEDVALAYKLETQERTTIAERASLHTQYHQETRDLRERHVSSVNEEFCQIQKDRRHWKNNEPYYSYHFNPKRSAQINQQSAYNKEVSLLSGIAKHTGFPAAPDLRGAAPDAIQEDLRRMKLESRPTSYVTQVANKTHNEEMAGEEQFLEKNVWARANPATSITHQALMLRPNGGQDTNGGHSPSNPHSENVTQLTDPQMLVSRTLSHPQALLDSETMKMMPHAKRLPLHSGAATQHERHGGMTAPVPVRAFGGSDHVLPTEPLHEHAETKVNERRGRNKDSIASDQQLATYGGVNGATSTQSNFYAPARSKETGNGEMHYRLSPGGMKGTNMSLTPTASTHAIDSIRSR